MDKRCAAIVTALVIFGVPCVCSYGYGTYGYTMFPSMLMDNYYRGYSSYGFPAHVKGGYGYPIHGLSNYGHGHHPYHYGNSYYGYNKHGYYYYPMANTFPIYGYGPHYGYGYGNRYVNQYPGGWYHPAAGIPGHHHQIHHPYGGHYRPRSVLGNIGYVMRDLFPYLLILKVAG